MSEASPFTLEDRGISPKDCRSLLAAVLRQALWDYHAPVNLNYGVDRNVKHRFDAREYVHRKGGGLFSFDGICRALGMNAERVRERVKRGPINFKDDANRRWR